MILGVDFSTKAIHGALIPLEQGNGEPALVFRTYPIPPSLDPLKRYFHARLAMRALSADTDGYPVHLAVVEQPAGRFAARQMWGMFGAICSSLYGVSAVNALEPEEWRAELGLKTRHRTQGEAKRESIAAAETYRGVAGLNEHEAEALLIALAGRQQNNRLWSEGAA